MKLVIAVMSVVLFAGCATRTGPKLYDNAMLVVTTENAMLAQQQPRDSDFMRTLTLRLNEFTEAELAANGDLKSVKACGPRTMQIVQDLESLNIGNVTEVSGGFFRRSATAVKNDDVRMSIGTKVIDCATGAQLMKFSYQNNGPDPFEVLKKLARWNVREAYVQQLAPAPR